MISTDELAIADDNGIKGPNHQENYILCDKVIRFLDAAKKNPILFDTYSDALKTPAEAPIVESFEVVEIIGPNRSNTSATVYPFRSVKQVGRPKNKTKLLDF